MENLTAFVLGFLMYLIGFVTSVFTRVLLGLGIGYLLELVCGSFIIEGLNALLGSGAVQSGQLPEIFAVVVLIAGFFTTMKKEVADDDFS